MSRAVGGASAVGCGVFGLGGLLISIGLVVWLGSMALDGSTDEGRSPSTTVAGMTTSAVAGGAVLTADPSTDLAVKQQVHVTGTGFTPGAVVVEQCITKALHNGTTPCSDVGSVTVTVGVDGRLDLQAEVHRYLPEANTAYDCAAEPGFCSLRAHPVGTAGDAGIDAPLTFMSKPPGS